ncbi:MAG: isochorismatase family protein [Pseudomonadota bacterium]|nr:isochorismatase family protein [Pseudomonadota bacterium]
MATVRSGTQPVLVVVDVQVGVLRAGWEAARVIANVARCVDQARAQRVPVIWVQHHSDELPRGGADWQWVPELVPAETELRIDKRFPSSFEQTPLEAELARLGATHITLAGAQTNWCIRATAYAALERGYDLTLVEDAHTTDDVELGENRRLAAEGMVQDLNIAMSWLRYPGRSTTTAAAAALTFVGESNRETRAQP